MEGVEIGREDEGLATPSLVVGVGASAGGLAPLTAFVSHLVRETRMAFILCQHSSAEDAELLADVLRPHCSLPLELAVDGQPLRAGHVYLAPPNFDLVLEPPNVRFLRGLRQHPRSSIDTLFLSLADGLGPRSAGVILSGTGNDGTAGLQAIKAEGGLTFAQDEATAQQFAMPESAILAGHVDPDHVLPPVAIAAELNRLDLEGAGRLGLSGSEDAVAMAGVHGILRDSFGSDFSDYKQSSLRRRLHKRLTITSQASLTDYLELLRQSPGERAALYRDILISVTSFFRDPEMFVALESLVFPKITASRGSDDPVRIWVPGCSSGEEVYSLAICLAEFHAKKNRPLHLQIFGTDINPLALQKARAGTYPRSIEALVGTARLQAFFDPVEHGYQVKKVLRDCCVFAHQNVIADSPLSRMDLVSCRNLLIYFGAGLQERVVPVFHYALRSAESFLVLGKSELVDVFSDYFLPVEKTHKIYRKKEVPVRLSFQPSAHTHTRVRATPDKPAATVQHDTEYEVQRETDRFILANFCPAAVVVTENYDIIQFRGHTAPYLGPSGRASFNLYKMLHPDLLQPVRQAIEQVKAGDSRAVHCRQLRLKSAEVLRLVDVRVIPLRTPALSQRYFLIIFEEQTPPPEQRLPESRALDADSTELLPATDAEEIRRLTDDLEATRQHLQFVLDERDIGFEELQSANEEVTSSNEELQTLNQELETAKEELESSNEELTTLNEQLRSNMEQLARSEEQLRILVSGVTDYAIFMLDDKGIIRTWNEGAEKIKGYSKQEAIGQHFSIFYPQESRRLMRPEAGLAQALAVGRFEEEGRRLRKDGSLFWANVVISLLHDANGMPAGYVKVTRDITQRKQTEERLRQSEMKFRLLVSRVRDCAIFMLDPKGLVMSWNEGAERIKGYKAEEIIGRHFSQFYQPEDAAQTEAELRSAETNGSWEGEGWRLRKDGSRFWASIVITRIDDEAGRLLGYAKITRDVTDRQRLIAAQAEKSAAELASKAKTLFLANISHEIRTPLTSIVGYADFLREAPGLDASVTSYVEAITRSAKHLSGLVSEVLDLSKIEANQMEVERVEVPLAAELLSVMEMLRVKARAKGVSLNLSYATPVPRRIKTDPIRLRQILVNLLDNAVKFSDGGGVTLAVSYRPSPAEQRLYFTVADNGCGIAVDDQKRIFLPFMQAATGAVRRGGTGLGLSLARQFAMLLGGDLELKWSELGKGSVFEASIDPGPLEGEVLEHAAELGDGGQTRQTAKEDKLLQGTSILLVEDCADNQVLFREMLLRGGAHVVLANHGLEGVEAAVKQKFDVILMDLRMPVLDGHEATRQLRARGIRTPIIAFTAHSTKEERERSFASGCDDYISKPISTKDLHRVVAQWSRAS